MSAYNNARLFLTSANAKRLSENNRNAVQGAFYGNSKYVSCVHPVLCRRGFVQVVQERSFLRKFLGLLIEFHLRD